MVKARIFAEALTGIFRYILETVVGFLTNGFVAIAWATLWVWPIMAIIFWGVYAGWGIWTWLPLSAYIGGTFGFAYYFNKARRTIQNTLGGTGYDDNQRQPFERNHA